VSYLQLKGPSADLSKRVNTLLSTSRLLASTGGAGGSVYIPSSAKVDERSVTELLEVSGAVLSSFLVDSRLLCQPDL
jgi:hypothetical protein